MIMQNLSMYLSEMVRQKYRYHDPYNNYDDHLHHIMHMSEKMSILEATCQDI